MSFHLLLNRMLGRVFLRHFAPANKELRFKFMLNLECSKLYVDIIKPCEKEHHMVEQTALLSLRKHYEAEVHLLSKQLHFFPHCYISR